MLPLLLPLKLHSPTFTFILHNLLIMYKNFGSNRVQLVTREWSTNTLKK